MNHTNVIMDIHGLTVHIFASNHNRNNLHHSFLQLQLKAITRIGERGIIVFEHYILNSKRCCEMLLLLLWSVQGKPLIEDDQKLSIVTKAEDDEVPSESFSSNFWHVRHWREMFVKLLLVIVHGHFLDTWCFVIKHFQPYFSKAKISLQHPLKRIWFYKKSQKC